ncbi:hypothetical protein Q8F55_000028 [Vanrija albida]|uniref:F-box domain-containing protein n=1 Tax=Vanrija albida TaxID=181172 RepID=A0ABR3QC38_9TREE
MSALDHTAFPDIIDMIFGLSDVSSLIAWRATCSAFKKRADARLFPHVALDFSDQRVNLVSASTGVRLPFCPEKVHTADVRSPPSVGSSIDLEIKFTHLHTLRRVGTGATSDLGRDRFGLCGDVTRVKTLVDYYDLRDWRPGTCGVPTLDYAFPGMLRYVLHLRADAHCCPIHPCPVLGMPDVLPRPANDFTFTSFSDMVVVVHLPTQPSIATVYTTLSAALALALDAVFMAVDPAPSFTIVGFDELAALPLPGKDAHTQLHTLVAFIRNIQLKAQGGRVLSFASKDLSLRFISMDTWLEELGEKCELEGVWVGRE